MIENVRIFTGQSVIECGSVIVESGRIAHIYSNNKTPTETIELDFAGPRYSRPGHTLLPGLIDVHIHANEGDVRALPQALRFGVTTVCDMHNTWPFIYKLRRQRELGDCADLKTTSFAATVENGWPIPIVLAHDSSEEVS